MLPGGVLAIDLKASIVPLVVPKDYMETLEFTIYPDGRVVEQVTGISGASCAEVTAAIEEKLGIVLNQEKTSEFYQQTQENSATTAAQAQSYSQW